MIGTALPSVSTTSTGISRHRRVRMCGARRMVFMLVEPDKPDVVLGYHAPCATGVAPGDAPPGARKHVPRYPLVSVALVGRLAVSETRPGESLARCCSPTQCGTGMRAPSR